MNKVLGFILIIAGFCCLTTDVQAQSNTAARSTAQILDQSYRANPRYNFMVQQALRKQSPTFRFGRFRSLYMQTRQYDPIGDDAVEPINTLAYVVQNSEDAAEIDAALAEYQAHVKGHLANLRVVLLALSLAKQDPRFGHPTFFEWARDGIMQDVLNSGDGRSLDGAYDVITMAEETVLLGRLGVRYLGTQANHEGYYYYNTHEVIDNRTGQRRFIFVNTTRPVRYLNSKQAEQDRNTFSILQ